MNGSRGKVKNNCTSSPASISVIASSKSGFFDVSVSPAHLLFRIFRNLPLTLDLIFAARKTAIE
jgi:hypothetical protein